MCQDQGAKKRTEGQGSLEETKSAGPDTQDVFGVNRQQGRGAAEQNGEQIQGNRS